MEANNSLRSVNKKSLGIVFLLLVSGWLWSQAKPPANDMPERYQAWLNLVHYHIQPVEREVFLKLRDNRERDIFIETFWKQRDPTPGTPENEYRDELVKRFQYVNKIYGRSTVRPGWQTDMGRIYMILGEPVSIERFETSSFIVPCQAWTYYGDPRKSLPNLFVLLFFQRGGVGEFKLYDPVSDGPARLLVNQRDIDPFDYEDLYDRIREIAPTLADLSLTLVPGEYSHGFQPSPRNAIIMADIFESPKKDVNPAYATHFLDYMGVVSTEYMTNFVDSESVTNLIQDPVTGLRFLHFSIVPKTVTLDYYEPKSQHYCNYQVNASLRDGETIIFQYTRDFPLYFGDDEVDRIRANGVAIEDSFPVSEGKYRLIILMTNAIGKEFTIVEKDLVVPALSTVPRIDGPFIGYRFETYEREFHVPFKIIDKKLLTDPKNTFGSSEDIAILFNVMNVTEEIRQGGEARISVRGLRPVDPVTRTFKATLSQHGSESNLTISQVFSAKELEPDYYELVISLVGADGQVLDEKKETFVVSANELVSHPIAHAKKFPLANQFLFNYMLAGQADKMNRTAEADELYKKAFGLNPDYKEGLVRYAEFLLRTGAFGEALALAERLSADDGRRFEYLSLKGRALMGLQKYEEALKELAEANKIYNSEIQVLNAMGICYQKTGQPRRALDAFEASLKLNPAQEDIKKLVEELKK